MTQWHLFFGGGGVTDSKGLLHVASHFEFFRGISDRHVCTASGFHEHTGIIYTEGFTNHNETNTQTDGRHFHRTQHGVSHALQAYFLVQGIMGSVFFQQNRR